MYLHKFTFNYFAENTYVLWDETKQCVIIDPGCCNAKEEQELAGFITQNQLIPVVLLNTHCHIDHILGNAFVMEKYNTPLKFNKKDLEVFNAGKVVADAYGISYKVSPEPSEFIEEGDQITFGTTILDILFTPGHSPGSICFVNHTYKILISGDVLFKESIGRTDLPGGSYNELENSIQSKLYDLEDSYSVFPGHGEETEIGYEKRNNMFVRAK